MARVLFLITIISSLLFVSISPLWSQDAGRNQNASLVLDFQTTAEDTQSSSTIENAPVIENNRFTVTLVLTGATDLIGVNCDLDFDESVLQLVEIHEARSDLNFDGRANIADILTLGERFNLSTDQNGFAYFDRDASGNSANVIDTADVDAVQDFIGETTLFWTSNPNDDVSNPIRESVEIFEDPSISNQNGIINDIVVVLLPRVHPDQGFLQDFGFDGDARIADITFEIVNADAASTEITFTEALVIDEGTTITTTEIQNASQPQAEPVTIQLQ